MNGDGEHRQYTPIHASFEVMARAREEVTSYHILGIDFAYRILAPSSVLSLPNATGKLGKHRGRV